MLPPSPFWPIAHNRRLPYHARLLEVLLGHVDAAARRLYKADDGQEASEEQARATFAPPIQALLDELQQLLVDSRTLPPTEWKAQH
ncbi:MAG TPA: hypothetical protein VEI97_11910, partial [bacterium]|nr:hypothetical protein [bacterium]